jgi:putative intracellular protease/amidase
VPTVLIPVPSRDFDPTEAGVSWRVLTDLGHRVVFATPDGRPAEGDQMMLTGEGLDPWARRAAARHLIVMGRAVRADARGRIAYSQMVRSPEFTHPIAWEAISVADYDGLLLPGGHRARGMREYLESARLQEVVVEAFRQSMPVAAICHGVLLAARSIDPATRRSVLYGRRTTSLTWSQERQAWRIGRVIRFWDPDYFRTYIEEPGQPAGCMSVQAEVTRALARPEDYEDVPAHAPDARLKRTGLHRDSLEDARPAFVVQDGNYLSARWPGDAHTFAEQFSTILKKVPAPPDPAGPEGHAER